MQSHDPWPSVPATGLHGWFLMSTAQSKLEIACSCDHNCGYTVFQGLTTVQLVGFCLYNIVSLEANTNMKVTLWSQGYRRAMWFYVQKLAEFSQKILSLRQTSLSKYKINGLGCEGRRPPLPTITYAFVSNICKRKYPNSSKWNLYLIYKKKIKHNFQVLLGI